MAVAEPDLARLFGRSGVGLLVVDRQGTVLWANDALPALLGFALDDFVGRPFSCLQGEHTRGAEDVLRRGVELCAQEARLRHRDGSILHVLVSSTCCREAGDDGHVCYLVQDVTRRRRAERRLEAQISIVGTLATAASLADAAPQILEAICLTTGWSWGTLWGLEVAAGATVTPATDGREDHPGRHDQVLRCIELWQRPHAAAGTFESVTRRLTYRRGVGLPGAVWASGRPAWIDDVSTVDGESPRWAAAASDCAPRGALAFPVLTRHGGVIGVMEFFSRHPREPDPDLLEMMGGVGRQVGLYVERSRGEQALVGSEARNAAIVRASLDPVISFDDRGRVLEWNPAAELTFGYARDEALGRRAAELIVPPRLRHQHGLGLGPGGSTGERMMVVGQRLETVAVRKGGEEFPIELAVTRNATAGPPTFTGQLRDLSERKRSEATSASLRAVLKELLVARDIQESVLPKRAPQLPGIELAGMVRAAAHCSGDFYDYLTTTDGRGVIVALGDASGHGVGPALVASETATCLRTLSRVYARVDHLLTEANSILADLTPPATFVTMLLVAVDASTRCLTYANAGHPSGLVIGPDRRVKAELASMDLPLAVCPDVAYQGGGPVCLGAGDLALLVSDGLLEAWSPEGEPFGVERMRQLACALQHEPAAVVVERLYDAVRAFSGWAPQHDDMSAVAIKVTARMTDGAAPAP